MHSLKDISIKESKLNEGDLLAGFWDSLDGLSYWLDDCPSQLKEARLGLLVAMAYLIPAGVSDIDNKKMREEFNESEELKSIIRDPCVACGRKSQARHHIIQLQHGGGNHRENLCGICNTCHARLHPWMQKGSVKPTRKKARGRVARKKPKKPKKTRTARDHRLAKKRKREIEIDRLKGLHLFRREGNKRIVLRGPHAGKYLENMLKGELQDSLDTLRGSLTPENIRILESAIKLK